MDILIIESSNVKLDKMNGDYIFEGTFTKFGVKNRNNRIYESKEFLPHIAKLKPLVDSKKLLGELDHPNDFEIRLDRCSHLIEKLEYDKTSNRILGKIRLLDTVKGRNAKALADAGIPLHVSSRASGRVREDGTVEIGELYTYDLVAVPGFEEAEMERIMESKTTKEANKLKAIINESRNVDYSKMQLINEDLGIPNDSNIQIYKLKDLKNNTKQMSEVLSRADLQAWENHIIENFNNLKKEVSQKDAIIESLKNDIARRDMESKEKESKFVAYLDEMADTITRLENSYVNESKLKEFEASKVKPIEDYLSTEVYKSVTEKFNMLDKLVEHVDAFIDEYNEVRETQEKIKMFIDEFVTEHNLLKEYAEYIKDGLTSVDDKATKLEESYNNYKDYANYTAEVVTSIEEKQEAISKHSNYLSEKLNQAVNYAEEIAMNSERVKDYVQYLSENTKSLTDYTTIFSEQVVEQFNNINEGKVGNVKKSSTAKLNNTYEKELNEKLSMLLNESVTTNLNYLDFIPTSLKPVWESLSESRKSEIRQEAQAYKLDTVDSIDKFWSSRDLRTVQYKNTPVNEANNKVYDNFSYNIDPNFIINTVKKNMMR